jgi:hypothetical protein
MYQEAPTVQKVILIIPVKVYRKSGSYHFWYIYIKNHKTKYIQNRYVCRTWCKRTNYASIVNNIDRVHEACLNSGNTNDVHVPLIVLPTTSSSRILIPPTLANSEPLQREWLSSPAKQKLKCVKNNPILEKSRKKKKNTVRKRRMNIESRKTDPFCRTRRAKEGVSSGRNATFLPPLSSKL